MLTSTPEECWWNWGTGREGETVKKDLAFLTTTSYGSHEDPDSALHVLLFL